MKKEECTVWIPKKLLAMLDEVDEKKLKKIVSNQLKAKEYVILYASNLTRGYFDYVNGESKMFHLHSGILKKFIGRHYSVISDFMVENVMIDCDESYLNNFYSKSYCITDEMFKDGICSYIVQNKIIKRKLKKRNTQLLLEANENIIASYLLDQVYPHLTIPSNEELLELGKKLAENEVMTNKQKIITMKTDAEIDYDERSYVEDSIALFNLLTADGLMVPRTGGEKSGGRVVGSCILSPSWCRSRIRINGNPIVEIDFETFHPNLLKKIYDVSREHITHDEISVFLRINRARAKRLNLSFFNLELYLFKKSPLFKYYASEHPVMLQGIIRDKENDDYENLVSLKSFTLEVKIMTEVVKRLIQEKILCLYVYDAMYSEVQNAERVKEIMDEVALEMGVNTTAKINYKSKYHV